MKRSATILPLAILGLVSACSSEVQLPKVEVKPYEKMTGGDALAEVNGSPITTKEMDERVNRSTFQTAAEVTADKKKEFLDELIGNEVMYQEAKAKGYADHPRVKMMMVNLLQHDALAPAETMQIDEKETKHYFDTHHDEFVIPEKVRARRIVVSFGTDKAAAKAKAEEVRKEAMAAPNDFGKIAADKSDGPEKSRQGELGYFASNGRPGLDDKIVSAAFAIKDNGISPVFENAEGWNIVKVENRAPRTERTFDQVKKSIERKLLTDRRKAMLDNYVADLKNKAKIQTNDQALASYTPTIQPKPAFNPMMMQQLQQMGAAGHPDMGGGQPPIVMQPPAPANGPH
ncbi:MAG TPA: peptidylprolyl isomerase [bacterium]|nr:peptidylprolyl isomerase [bacterium]